MIKIHESSQYDKFQPHTFNRDVVVTKRLERSMKKYGWLSAYPMFVVMQEGEKVIKDGHHRFHVARSLRIPLKYVIEGGTTAEYEEIPMYDIDGACIKWSLRDFLVSNARGGDMDFQYVLDYHKKTKFPLAICVAVCAGQAASSKHLIEKVKRSCYKIGDQSHAELLWSIGRQLKILRIDFYANTSFLLALSKCALVPEFDGDRFARKAETYRSEMVKQPSVDRYMDMIEHIYNKGSKKDQMIPLSFMANARADERRLKLSKQRSK